MVLPATPVSPSEIISNYVAFHSPTKIRIKKSKQNFKKFKLNFFVDRRFKIQPLKIYPNFLPKTEFLPSFFVSERSQIF